MDPQQPVAVKAKSKSKPARRRRPRRRPLEAWNVVLLDDDDHTYAYVIDMLGRVCGHPAGRAKRLAGEVDASGRAVVFTGHRELAELKAEQVSAFGADLRVAECRGSMSAVVEKAG